MADLAADEQDILDAFDQDELKSVATRPELARLRAAARATP